MPTRRHPWQQPTPRLLAAAALLASLPMLNLPTWAGSSTASSIWDRSHALEQARAQVPQGAVITAEHCQEVEVGIGNFHYLCTVEFNPAPPGTPAATPNPPTGQ